jgi:hypothetical protein
MVECFRSREQLNGTLLEKTRSDMWVSASKEDVFLGQCETVSIRNAQDSERSNIIVGNAAECYLVPDVRDYC